MSAKEATAREPGAEKLRRAEREEYLKRRQRKTILERCRRIAVVGASESPDSASFVSVEKLLGLGLEILPVLPGCQSYLGLACYSRVRDLPGDVDIVQVYPDEKIDLLSVAREAAEKGAKAFWVEKGWATEQVRELLARSRVQIVEGEGLEREYIKHTSFPARAERVVQAEKGTVAVTQFMSKDPVTVRATDGINVAIEKMKKGHFRHLPVVDDHGKLIGMISDRDIRLIRPSLAFVNPEDAELQLMSTLVRQAAVFDPVIVGPDAPLEHAAELLLRWEIGGLPVVDDKDRLVGMITYTDLLRAFLQR